MILIQSSPIQGIRIRRSRSLRAQAKASVRLCRCPHHLKHFTIKWFTEIPHTTLHCDFRFHATVLWSLKLHILIVPEFIQSSFKMCQWC